MTEFSLLFSFSFASHVRADEIIMDPKMEEMRSNGEEDEVCGDHAVKLIKHLFTILNQEETASELLREVLEISGAKKRRKD